jgi:hypothetical protein
LRRSPRGPSRGPSRRAGRGHRARWAAVAGAIGLVGAAAALDSLPMTAASFTARTSNGGSAFAAATSFCTSPGSTTLTVVNDSTLRENDPDGNYGNNPTLEVRSHNGDDRRVIIRPALPTVPDHCELTTATLTLRVTGYRAGRTYQAYLAASDWAFNTVTWNNQPAMVGVPTSAATTDTTWSISVLPQVQAILSSGDNYGVIIRDSVEDSAPDLNNKYDSLDGSVEPSVTYTWS